MQIFPRELNLLPLVLGVLGTAVSVLLVGVFWYFFSPKNLQVGYAPKQPISYSHRLHVGELGIDCRYCHAQVERSHEAMVPPTQTCVGCHTLVRRDSPKLAPLWESWDNDTPVQWVRVHKLPDHVFFDHSVHLAAGVGCVSCHGRVDQKEVVDVEQPISMGWCLNCHRDPEPILRPKDKITDMTYKPDSEWKQKAHELASTLNPPRHCSGCHR